MNCKHPTLYVLGPENKPAPYGYCMLCEVARLTADIATLERRERSRNNRIAELEDALPALDARKEEAGGSLRAISDAMTAIAEVKAYAASLEKQLEVANGTLRDYRDFWNRYRMPPLARPSCLVCGKPPAEWPPAIQHMNVPSVVVCAACAYPAATAEGDTHN